MDDTSLGLLTMIVGAILGGVIAPLGQEIVDRFFRRRNRALGLHSAILFLFVANGIWIIGEITLQILYLSDAQFSGSAYALGLILALGLFISAAASLWIAYQQLPSAPSHALTFLEHRGGPLAFFIFGNLLWVVGEALQMLLEAASELSGWELNAVGLSLRVLTALGAAVLFLVAARKMWLGTPALISGSEANTRAVAPVQESVAGDNRSEAL